MPPSTSQIMVPAAAPARTAGATLIATTPTTTATTSPTTSASPLYSGHGTPAIVPSEVFAEAIEWMCSAVVTGSGYSMTMISGNRNTGPPHRAARSGPYVGLMPLSGEYAPSTSGWAREQAEKYMESGGT